MSEISVSITFVLRVLHSVYGLIPKFLNLLRRPKITIEIRNQNIICKTDNNVESHISYPCVIVSFEKDVKVDVRSIKLNNESLHCMISRDPYFLRQDSKSNSHITIINNRIMPFIHENWSLLTQRSCWFEVKKHDQEILPLYIRKEMSHFIFRHKEKSRVFFAKNKVILSLNIDGVEHEYGISLINFCQTVINNLAFQDAPL